MKTKAHSRKAAVAAIAVMATTMALLTACGGDSESMEKTATSVPPTKAAATATRSASTPTAQAPQATHTNAAPSVEATSTPVPGAPASPTVPPAPPVQPTAPPPPPPTTAPPPPPPPPPAAGVSISISGVGSVFSPSSGTTRVGAPTTITFNNQDVDVIHDFVLFSPTGTQLAATELAAGPIVQTVTFTPAAAGGYSFKCSVHPQQMRGVITVQ